MASLAETAEFVDRMKKHGFRNIQELSVITTEGLLQLRALLSTQLEVVTISNKYLSVDVTPMLAGRALRIIDRRTGQCVTAYDVRRSLFFPFCGGLESRVGEQSRYYGWVEPGKVTQRTETSVTIALQTTNGFKLERTLDLAQDKPVIKVKSVLTNPADEARSARLRSHLELDLGDLNSTRVSFESLSGQKVDKDMTDIVAGLREGEYYRSQNTPRGSWSFTGSKGLRLTQRFDNEQMDYTWLYAYPEDLGELEVELWAKRVVLEPGQSAALDHEIVVHSKE